MCASYISYLLSDVIVVTSEACRSEMLALPKKHGLELRLDVVCPSSDAQDDHGTADALRLVYSKCVKSIQRQEVSVKPIK